MTLGLRYWGLTIVAAGAVSWACKVDPGGMTTFTDPCDELQGDLTCASLFADRPYCSLCATENQGCVAALPAVECQPNGSGGSQGSTSEAETTGSSSSDSSTTAEIDSTGMSSSSTGEPSCALEGELDPACVELDAARPFCVDAACVGCEPAGGDSFCAARDELAPACDALAGRCVPCGDLERQACAEATPVCGSDGACSACTSHDECPQTACHLAADDPLLGRCFAPDEVLWIDNTSPCPGLGTETEPACSLQDTADTLVPGDVRVLRIAGGGAPYAERASFDGEMTVAIIGVDAPVISGNPLQQAATLSLVDGVTAYVQGVELDGNSLTHGLMCNFSAAVVQDVRIRDNDGWGVFEFDPCALDVQRTVISGNEDGGLRIAGGELRLTNSAVGLNGIGGNSTGVRVEDADVHILYSTIVGNDGVGADSMQCDNSTGTLRNSIFAGQDGVSVSLDCFPLMMENNAMDAANFASGSNVEVEPYNGIYFNNPTTGNFTLSAPPLTPYGGVALWLPGDPELDADGTSRPLDGGLGYAGVDEP